MDNATQNAELNYDVNLDAKGLNCPLPILKAKLALNKMQPGQILHVEATDPHAIIDFEAYCARTGHKILHTRNNAGIIEFFINRAAAPKQI
jgi:tRNA 2-thiouridine synthesizing protein A